MFNLFVLDRSLSSIVHRKWIVDVHRLVSKCGSDGKWTKKLLGHCFEPQAPIHTWLFYPLWDRAFVPRGPTRGVFAATSAVTWHCEWRPTVCERAPVVITCVPGVLPAGPQAPPRQAGPRMHMMCWNLSHQSPPNKGSHELLPTGIWLLTFFNNTLKKVKSWQFWFIGGRKLTNYKLKECRFSKRLIIMNPLAPDVHATWTGCALWYGIVIWNIVVMKIQCCTSTWLVVLTPCSLEHSFFVGFILQNFMTPDSMNQDATPGTGGWSEDKVFFGNLYISL